MVKLIGMLLVMSSLFALIAGAFIDAKYASASSTGNLVTNITSQPAIITGPAYYVEAIAFSYSIISMLMGLVFLLRF